MQEFSRIIQPVTTIFNEYVVKYNKVSLIDQIYEEREEKNCSITYRLCSMIDSML
jgi:hypothetical protein